MRKANSKFRGNNNNNNTIYSLNYKFDSVSAAGKFSGTALDLIKKYNELAKEAQSNGNYVEMEVFRQYAEHYRKIVTEINERKSQFRDNAQPQGQNIAEAENTNSAADNENTASEAVDNGLVETLPAEQTTDAANADQPEPRRRNRRGFTIVEVVKTDETKEEPQEENAQPIRKTRRPRLVKSKVEVAKDSAENN
ncbi:MAG: DUF4167 domain-containing protein [Alphaproteobacteria bacterium]|nr:DUF4167 domain-containing protein [Alphaproteobacteria bacterium]